MSSCRRCGYTLKAHVFAGYAETCDDFEEDDRSPNEEPMPSDSCPECGGRGACGCLR